MALEFFETWQYDNAQTISQRYPGSTYGVDLGTVRGLPLHSGSKVQVDEVSQTVQKKHESFGVILEFGSSGTLAGNSNATLSVFGIKINAVGGKCYVYGEEVNITVDTKLHLQFTYQNRKHFLTVLVDGVVVAEGRVVHVELDPSIKVEGLWESSGLPNLLTAVVFRKGLNPVKINTVNIISGRATSVTGMDLSNITNNPEDRQGVKAFACSYDIDVPAGSRVYLAAKSPNAFTVTNGAEHQLKQKECTCLPVLKTQTGRLHIGYTE